MRIRKEHLLACEARQALPAGTAERVWADLSAQLAEEPAFKTRYVLYYFGAMLFILPASLFLAPALARMTDAALFALSTVFVGAMLWGADALKRRTWRIPAGILGAAAVAATPVAAYLLLKAFGVDFDTSTRHVRDFHTHIRAEWVLVELVTLVVAVLALWRVREPFLVMPVSVVLWYMGMDLAQLLVQSNGGRLWDDWQSRAQYTAAFGALVMAVAWSVERRTQHTARDYSFWLWIFGTLGFWGGLSASGNGGELGKAVYAVINVALVFAGAWVGRRVLTVCGALGCTAYLGHLCLKAFADSALFPLVVMALGGGLIYLAMRWPRLEAALAGMAGRARP